MSGPLVGQGPPVREHAPPGYREHERRREAFCGFGIMALPFDSGHVLGLRVMPENDYVPYSTVWHRTPDRKWSVYVDAPNHQEFYPRLFGPVLARSGQADIRVTWSNARTLEVVMDAPRLEWTVRLQGSPFTRLANKVLPHLPLDVYRRRPALALIRDLADRALGILAEGCIYVEIDDQEAYRERLWVFEGYDGARAPVPPAGP